MYESIKDAIEDNPLHMSYGRRGIDGKPIAYAYILMSNEKTERAHSAAEVIEKYSSSVSRL
jgi:hypothetical protein